VIKQLYKVSGVAACSKVFAVRSVMELAVEQDVFYCLDWLTTRAGYLFLCVLREESLCV